jgi:plasmid stabilization system protein ParE
VRRVVIAELAAGDLERILRQSEPAFGARARRRYRALIDRAIRDVADDPDRPGVRAIDDVRAGYRLYHLRFSRRTGAGPPVGKPRHLLAFHLRGPDRLVTAAVLHERQLVERHLDP